MSLPFKKGKNPHLQMTLEKRRCWFQPAPTS